MKILLTGETRYLGKKLLLKLIYHGYKIICTSGDKNRLSTPTSFSGKVEFIEDDLINSKSLKKYQMSIFQILSEYPSLIVFRIKEPVESQINRNVLIVFGVLEVRWVGITPMCYGS